MQPLWGRDLASTWRSAWVGRTPGPLTLRATDQRCGEAGPDVLPEKHELHRRVVLREPVASMGCMVCSGPQGLTQCCSKMAAGPQRGWRSSNGTSWNSKRLCCSTFHVLTACSMLLAKTYCPKGDLCGLCQAGLWMLSQSLHCCREEDAELQRAIQEPSS